MTNKVHTIILAVSLAVVFVLLIATNMAIKSFEMKMAAAGVYDLFLWAKIWVGAPSALVLLCVMIGAFAYAKLDS